METVGSSISSGGRARRRLELGGGEGVADGDLVGAGEPDDVAGGDLVDLAVLEAARDPEVRHARGLACPSSPSRALGVADLEVARRDALQLVADPEAACEHAAAADAADVVAPGERADLHEEGRVLVDLGRRHLLDDRLEEVVHAGVGELRSSAGERPPPSAGAPRARALRAGTRRGR